MIQQAALNVVSTSSSTSSNVVAVLLSSSAKAIGYGGGGGDGDDSSINSSGKKKKEKKKKKKKAVFRHNSSVTPHKQMKLSLRRKESLKNVSLQCDVTQKLLTPHLCPHLHNFVYLLFNIWWSFHSFVFFCVVLNSK